MSLYLRTLLHTSHHSVDVDAAEQSLAFAFEVSAEECVGLVGCSLHTLLTSPVHLGQTLRELHDGFEETTWEPCRRHETSSVGGGLLEPSDCQSLSCQLDKARSTEESPTTGLTAVVAFNVPANGGHLKC